MKRKNQRIKILYLIPSFRTGGAELQLLSLVKGIDKSRFQITIAVFYSGHDLDDEFCAVPGVDVVFLEKKSGLDFSWLRNLFLLLKTEHLDILQAYNVSARLYGILFGKMTNVPYLIATERTAKLLFSSFGARVYLWFEKYAIRRADLVIANSEAGRRFSMSRGVPSDKVKVIYNGIDPERLQIKTPGRTIRQQFNIPENAVCIGMIARAETHKAPLTFMQVAKAVNRQVTHSCFVFVGDGPMLADMKTFAVSSNMDVIFTGRQNKVADFLNAMDIVILTSNKVEGCSNVLIEAMACGKPIVATDVGGNRELIQHGENGFVVPPQQVSEMSNAIVQLCGDKTLRMQFSDNAFKMAEKKYSQRSMTHAFETLYDRAWAMIRERN